MLHEQHKLYRRDSLFDLDSLWSNCQTSRQSEALQLIDSQMDFPLVSSDWSLLPSASQDLLGC
jgi:hypothetical protein